jgi:ribose-phosphate pyrophosphokinase
LAVLTIRVVGDPVLRRKAGRVAKIDASIQELIDDMIDGGGTLIGAVEALVRAGARNIYFVSVHGLLSGRAIERIAACPHIKKIGLVNTLDIPPEKLEPIKDRVVILHIEDLLSRVIRRTFEGRSIFGYQSES